MSKQNQLAGNWENEEPVFDDPEPWHPIETRLVTWSFIAALLSLLLFGTLVHQYIL